MMALGVGLENGIVHAADEQHGPITVHLRETTRERVCSLRSHHRQAEVQRYFEWKRAALAPACCRRSGVDFLERMVVETWGRTTGSPAPRATTRSRSRAAPTFQGQWSDEVEFSDAVGACPICQGRDLNDWDRRCPKCGDVMVKGELEALWD